MQTQTQLSWWRLNPHTSLLNPVALCSLSYNTSQWLLPQQWKYVLTKWWLANTQFSTNQASGEFCAHLHRLTTNLSTTLVPIAIFFLCLCLALVTTGGVSWWAHTSSLLIEIKVQLRWRWILKEQLVKFSSASRKLDSCWLFEKGQGTSIALRNGVSVLMNSMTLNNGAGSVIFPDNIQSEWTPLYVDECEGNIDASKRTDTCFAQSAVPLSHASILRSQRKRKHLISYL